MTGPNGSPHGSPHGDLHQDPIAALPEPVLDDVRDATAALVFACIQRNVPEINQIVGKLLERYNGDGAFATCTALAIVIAHSLGLNVIAEDLSPQSQALAVYRLPQVVLFGDDGYRQRFDQARLFVSRHVSYQDQVNYHLVLADEGNHILHGLCESVAAVATPLPAEGS